MDVQLQELIDKIKSEGVEQAEAKAEQILEEARSRSDEILAEAQKQADEITAKAESEAQRLVQSGKEALAHAGRDLVLGLQKKIENLLGAVIETEVSKELSGDVLERAIMGVFESLGSASEQDTTLSLTESDFDALHQRLQSALSEKLRSGITISPSKTLSSGFKINVDSGAAYYQFSAAEIADVIAGFINPRLAEILKEAVERE